MANSHPVTANLVTPWVPGQSGNRLGQHGGLLNVAMRLRRATKDGKEVCDFLVGVLRDATERSAIRIQAAELILAYAYGKPRESIELIEERPGVDRRALIAALSPGERELLERLVDLALARTAPEAAIDTRAIPVISESQDARDAEPT
jgi:hypothetical protein